MAIVHSDRFARALIPGIYRNFDIGFNMRVSKREPIFNVEGSNRAWEEEVGVGGMSSNPLIQYDENGMIGAFDYYEGFGQRYTHKEYPADLILQRKFMDDESWGLINRHVQKAGIAANNLMETQAADVFNNGFSTSNNWGDGKPLFAADHPANSAGSAPTGDNVEPLALSYNNINAVINNMRKFTDDQGNILGVVPDTILVPVELYQEAVEVLRATGKPQNQAFNQASSFSGPDIGPLRIISWEYLTDAQHWFVLDSAMARMSLHWFNRIPFGLTEAMYENQVRYRYQFYGRWSYGPSDWRFAFGCNP